MSSTTLRRLCGIVLVVFIILANGQAVSAQCSGTVMNAISEFTFPTQLITFETFPGGGAVPYGSANLVDQWKVSPYGVRITDSTSANGASAVSQAFGIFPHSGTRAVTHSESTSNGFIQFQFVVPGTDTNTAYQEVGVWVQNGDAGAETIQFFDCNNNTICSLAGPLPPGLGGSGDKFIAIRYAPGISRVKVNGNGYFMCDDLQFGGNVACGGGGNQPPFITLGPTANLPVQNNSICGSNPLVISATDPNDPVANLNWSIQTLPTNGSASFQGGTSGGSVTVCYAPNPNQCMNDSFVVRVVDPGGLDDTIVVTVIMSNPPPDITEGGSVSKSVPQDSTCPSAGNIVNLHATDPSDPAGNLNWSIDTQPATGSVSFVGGTVGGSVNVCYQPFGSQSAPDSFVVRVGDICNAEDFILVNITVFGCSGANKANVNLDALVNGRDISAFVGVLLSPGSATPEQLCRADIGSAADSCAPDSVVDLNDVPGFILYLLNGGCNAPPIIQQGEGPLPLTVQPNSSCGAPNQLNLSATDVDGPLASLTWSILPAPTSGSASFIGGNTGGSVTVCYTPNASQCAPDTFTVRVQDGAGGVDTIPISVTVNNSAPVITEGTSANLSVPHNSTTCPAAVNQRTLNATDSDTNPSLLSWSIQTQPTQGAASIVGATMGASVTVCYAPTSNQCTANFFVVRVQDPCGGSDTITVNTSITNQAPVITQGTSVPLGVGHNSTCPGAPNQLTLNATDADANANLLTWSILTQPPAGQGTASVVGSGGSATVCYAPATNQCSASSFVVRVQDGCGATDTITVNTSINNQAPIIGQGDSTPLNVQPNTTCPSAPNQISLTATHPDGTLAQLNWSIPTQPPAGQGTASFVGGTNGGSVTVCYAPAAGQSQATSFVVRVTDNCNGVDNITVNVTIASSNQAPVITQGMATNLVVPKNSICFDPLNEKVLNATDDAPVSQLTWSIIAPFPVNGLASFNGTTSGGTVTICYEPNPEQAAADAIVVRVQDTQGGIDDITLNVSVQNDPPAIDQGHGPLSLSVQPNSICPGAPNQVDISANDPDGVDDSMVWTILDPANTGTVSFINGISTGQAITVCYQPNAAQSAADDFTIKVTDSCGGIDTIVVQVSVP